jgi:hypothetical protein
MRPRESLASPVASGHTSSSNGHHDPMVITTRGTLMIACDFAFTSIDGAPLPFAASHSRLESLPLLGPPQMFAGFVREGCGRKMRPSVLCRLAGFVISDDKT